MQASDPENINTETKGRSLTVAEQQALFELEQKKLQVEELQLKVKELKRPEYSRLSFWTSSAAVIIAIGSVIGQNYLSNIKNENAALSLAKSVNLRDSANAELKRSQLKLDHNKDSLALLGRRIDSAKAILASLPKSISADPKYTGKLDQIRKLFALPGGDAAGVTTNNGAAAKPSITVAQLHAIFPTMADDKASSLKTQLDRLLPLSDINTPERKAMFIAQTAYESLDFTFVTENINYTADGLLSLYPQKFDAATARKYVGHPDKIANRVYANRMGNGDEQSGDGWRYRGRGYLIVLGKANYAELAKFSGIDLLKQPDLLATTYPISSVCFFWIKNDLNSFADKGDVKTVTKKINGGFNGLSRRTDLYNKALKVLKAG